MIIGNQILCILSIRKSADLESDKDAEWAALRGLCDGVQEGVRTCQAASTIVV
jgi:hypothetical protein